MAVAQTASLKETEHLSQGEDNINIEYTYGAYKAGAFRDKISRQRGVLMDELFGHLSPLLIDEAFDQTLKTTMNAVLLNDLWQGHRDEHRPEDASVREFQISDTSFDTIKVQLLALGLIAKSATKKARSVNDRAAYWSLTPAGETLMMKLRAIRRAAPSPGAPAQARDATAPAGVFSSLAAASHRRRHGTHHCSHRTLGA